MHPLGRWILIAFCKHSLVVYAEGQIFKPAGTGLDIQIYKIQFPWNFGARTFGLPTGTF